MCTGIFLKYFGLPDDESLRLMEQLWSKISESGKSERTSVIRTILGEKLATIFVLSLNSSFSVKEAIVLNTRTHKPEKIKPTVSGTPKETDKSDIQDKVITLG